MIEEEAILIILVTVVADRSGCAAEAIRASCVASTYVRRCCCYGPLRLGRRQEAEVTEVFKNHMEMTAPLLCYL